MSDVDPLLRWRDEFPILQETTYLINNSLGAMPRAVYDSLHEYAEMWGSRGIRAWGEGWYDMGVELGNLIGSIIGAPLDTVSMHTNITLALAQLLSTFDYNGPRNKIVIEAGIFPSDFYLLRGLIPSHIDVQMVSGEGGPLEVLPGRIAEAIDTRTLFVLTSHVLFRSAYILDLAPIVEKARAVGAQIIVDAYHAPGIIPVDVIALDVDYYLGGVLKWLCGGPGGVFMYGREDRLRTVKPRITGWMAHQRPFDFEIADIALRDGAFRLANGTPPIPVFYAARPGVEIIHEVGVSNIRAKSMRQTALMIDLADQHGWAVSSPRDPDRRGGTVVINPPHAYEVSREMLARRILIDYRPNAGIRVSPHFYNSDEEVHGCIDAIAEILSSGAWQRHTQSRSFVT